MSNLLSQISVSALTVLPVTPLVNLASSQRVAVVYDATRYDILHHETEATTRCRAAAYAIGGLALNVAGGAGAVTLMPIVGPSALACLASISLLGSAVANDHFIRKSCRPALPEHSQPVWQRPRRAVTWIASHIAMGATVGFACGVLPFLSAARLAAGLAIGVGIPVATYLVQLLRRNFSAMRCQKKHTTMPLCRNIRAPRCFSNANIPPLLTPAFVAARTAGTLLPMNTGYYLLTMTLSSAALCAASVTFSSRRAHQLAKDAHRFDPAASSLLLSSAVVSSALWGCNAAAIRFGSVYSFAVSGRPSTMVGRGLRRSAQRHP